MTTIGCVPCAPDEELILTPTPPHGCPGCGCTSISQPPTSPTLSDSPTPTQPIHGREYLKSGAVPRAASPKPTAD
ncbi:hypothetical protein CC1G_04887 [Coprinopsis cinerea okayama7|uniref:Uncharacterized protein n=1 Tax=Coprinopsis cinerea (strain Okayama-7 / 130 / ATCC MYA-4618 / FGSC 9003) TaxID=240176 RepID=A8PFX9_COPC7|nr:hypothetical protein CC1G_04887 [Coprinopsis cinerea okayama7\|eukprot:XP_001841043.2 hypothetical protein CC1G_04887 [Coprinopsis cinerea okayama7\